MLSKQKDLIKKKSKKQLIDSLVCGKNVVTEDLHKRADEVKECEQATIIIIEYEHIVRTNKKTLFL